MGGAVLLTMLIILILFNVLMRSRIEQNARESIESVLGYGDKDSQPLYTPSVIEFFGESLGLGDQRSRVEKRLIEFCNEEQPEGITKAEIGKSIYYLEDKTVTASEITDSLTDSGEYSLNDLRETVIGALLPLIEGQRIIAYIDVTGETELIGSMTLFFLINAAALGAAAGVAGYLVGRRLERSQLVQKQFFENTSHELKTPLTSIRGYAEGIEKGVITDYAKTGRVIAAQTEKMSGLVEEILCMAKLESGSVSLEKEPVELTAFMQDCLMPFEGTVLTRGLNVKLQLEEMTVPADPEKLEHAISNLLTNALKYARTEIRISCGGGVIRIENDCEPLTDDALRHLFDRFYTGRGGNTGLGLSIARDLISLHGWKLTAERTESGVRFTIKC
jgi:signal transduction histidine kinase